MPIASQIMTKNVITVTKETPIRELAEILLEKGVNGVPVVDEQGAVIGVVCESDLVEYNKPLHIPTVFFILDSIIPIENPWRLASGFQENFGYHCWRYLFTSSYLRAV